jgi:autophagy-related protein 9
MIPDLRVPWWVSPFFSERLFLTRSLEWSISFCVMEYMFTEDQFTISSHFLKNPLFLQNRLRIVGVVHLLLLPFMLVFMTIHFFLQNAQQFHSSRAYLGPRQWSPLALWTFREFNELPHIFEDRINKAYIPANEFVSSFHNPYSAILARFAAYVSGSFVATLLLVSFFEEGALLYVHIAEHNLFWYLGVFSAVYAGTRSLIPDETKLKIHPEELITQVAANTHYFPSRWINRCHTQLVRDEMTELFPYKIYLFAMELLSVVLTPIVLCFSLPSSAQAIIDFVRYVNTIYTLTTVRQSFCSGNYLAPGDYNVIISKMIFQYFQKSLISVLLCSIINLTQGA